MKELRDIAKKAFLIGIGLSVVTRDKAQKIAKELLAKGKANEKEVTDFARKIVAESQKKEKMIRAKIEKETKKALCMAMKKSGKELNILKAKLKTVQKPKKKKAKKKR
ncbi:MAG: hypothetical protein ABIB71_04605 [Candidatus Woesearchaeota archaeon]